MASAPLEIKTARLRLRQLQHADLLAFAAMNADPEVMRFFPHPWSYQESEAALVWLRQGFQSRGFGVYGAEDIPGNLVGIVGLSVPTFEASFTPCVEILWRLALPYWGRGYASEAAGSVIAMAFSTLSLKELLAFTNTANWRSVRVMERIGMTRDPAADFDHPNVEDHRLKRHALYRITSQEWGEAGGRTPL